MALELKTVRSRTRGKTPVEFTFQGVGNVKTRKVPGKDNNPIIHNKDNKPVEYTFDKDGKLISADTALTIDKDGNLILPEGYRYVEVDDLETDGLLKGEEGFTELIQLYGTIPGKDADDTPLNRVINGALAHFNLLQRKAASPVQEVVTEDELTPLVAALVANGNLSEKDEAVWRRTVTQAAKQVEMERKDYVKMTREYKALAKAAKVPEGF